MENGSFVDDIHIYSYIYTVYIYIYTHTFTFTHTYDDDDDLPVKKRVISAATLNNQRVNAPASLRFAQRRRHAEPQARHQFHHKYMVFEPFPNGWS